ncbi:MAG: hypothetical protein Q8O67_26175 [Deltaproteobacteria bacterium]|nr:hypothetical protein [Deltaproteobacteria bacterium]
MSASIQTLSTYTGMNEVELQRRAQELQSSGKLKSLGALDAALLAATSGTNQNTVNAFDALSAGNAEPHALEEPAQVMARATTSGAGFAPAATTSTPSLSAANSPANLDKAATAGMGRIKGFVGEQEAAFDLGGAIGGAQTESASSSRNIEFEKLKNEMQKLSQIQTLMSNVLSSIHENAKAAINNIRG